MSPTPRDPPATNRAVIDRAVIESDIPASAL
jgi:hypothetical protein